MAPASRALCGADRRTLSVGGGPGGGGGEPATGAPAVATGPGTAAVPGRMAVAELAGVRAVRTSEGGGPGGGGGDPALGATAVEHAGVPATRVAEESVLPAFELVETSVVPVLAEEPEVATEDPGRAICKVLRLGAWPNGGGGEKPPIVETGVATAGLSSLELSTEVSMEAD